WLRGGTYVGTFSSRLAGTPSAPIIVRQYPGERATVTSPIGNGGTPAIAVNSGGYVWLWGFEVAGTDPNDRISTGVNLNAPGARAINLIIHDWAGNGIGAWIPAPDAVAYGNIVYNNGFHGTQDAPPSHGHGIYSHNQTGTKLFQDNILFNQFGKGFQIYGSDVSFLNNYDLEGNVS